MRRTHLMRSWLTPRRGVCLSKGLWVVGCGWRAGVRNPGSTRERQPGHSAAPARINGRGSAFLESCLNGIQASLSFTLHVQSRVNIKSAKHSTTNQSVKHMVLSRLETTLSRRKSGSFHIALEPIRGLDSRCMSSSKQQERINHRPVYRTSKFSTNRHRKLQPFRET